MMKDAPHHTAADLLRNARCRAGLTQRQLATRSGVAQPVIARLESGRSKPAFATVEKLLGACGMALDLHPVIGSEPGAGVDRTLIREMLRLSPAERLRVAAGSANNLARFLRSLRSPAGPRRSKS
jgi:transcriptional regulator with XRE-family HTH domain